MAFMSLTKYEQVLINLSIIKSKYYFTCYPIYSQELEPFLA